MHVHISILALFSGQLFDLRPGWRINHTRKKSEDKADGRVRDGA